MLPDHIIASLSSVPQTDFQQCKTVLDMLETGEKKSSEIEQVLRDIYSINEKKARTYIYVLDDLGLIAWEMRKAPTKEHPGNKICYVHIIGLKDVATRVENSGAEKNIDKFINYFDENKVLFYCDSCRKLFTYDKMVTNNGRCGNCNIILVEMTENDKIMAVNDFVSDLPQPIDSATVKDRIYRSLFPHLLPPPLPEKKKSQPASIKKLQPRRHVKEQPAMKKPESFGGVVSYNQAIEMLSWINVPSMEFTGDINISLMRSIIVSYEQAIEMLSWIDTHSDPGEFLGEFDIPITRAGMGTIMTARDPPSIQQPVAETRRTLPGKNPVKKPERDGMKKKHGTLINQRMQLAPAKTLSTIPIENEIVMHDAPMLSVDDVLSMTVPCIARECMRRWIVAIKCSFETLKTGTQRDERKKLLNVSKIFFFVNMAKRYLCQSLVGKNDRRLNGILTEAIDHLVNDGLIKVQSYHPKFVKKGVDEFIAMCNRGEIYGYDAHRDDIQRAIDDFNAVDERRSTQKETTENNGEGISVQVGASRGNTTRTIKKM
jgi:transcription initiation factor IIE alpha subunit